MATNYTKAVWEALSGVEILPHTPNTEYNAARPDISPQASRFQQGLVSFLSLPSATNVATALLKWPFKAINTGFAFVVAQTKENARSRSRLRRWIAAPILAIGAVITGAVSASLSLMLTLLAPFAEGYTALLKYIIFPSTIENPKPLKRRIAAAFGAALLLGATPFLAFSPYLGPIFAPVMTAIAHVAHIGLIPFVASVPGLLLSAFSAMGRFLSGSLKKKIVPPSVPAAFTRTAIPSPNTTQTPGTLIPSPSSQMASVAVVASLPPEQPGLVQSGLYTSPSSQSSGEGAAPRAASAFTRFTSPHFSPMQPTETSSFPRGSLSSDGSLSPPPQEEVPTATAIAFRPISPSTTVIASGAGAGAGGSETIDSLLENQSTGDSFQFNIQREDAKSDSASISSHPFAAQKIGRVPQPARRQLGPLTIAYWEDRCLKHITGERPAKAGSLIAQAHTHLLNGVDIIILSDSFILGRDIKLQKEAPIYVYSLRRMGHQAALSYHGPRASPGRASISATNISKEAHARLEKLHTEIGVNQVYRLTRLRMQYFIPLMVHDQDQSKKLPHVLPEQLAKQMATLIITWLRKHPNALASLTALQAVATTTSGPEAK